MTVRDVTNTAAGRCCSIRSFSDDCHHIQHHNPNNLHQSIRENQQQKHSRNVGSKSGTAAAIVVVVDAHVENGRSNSTHHGTTSPSSPLPPTMGMMKSHPITTIHGSPPKPINRRCNQETIRAVVTDAGPYSRIPGRRMHREACGVISLLLQLLLLTSIDSFTIPLQFHKKASSSQWSPSFIDILTKRYDDASGIRGTKTSEPVPPLPEETTIITTTNNSNQNVSAHDVRPMQKFDMDNRTNQSSLSSPDGMVQPPPPPPPPYDDDDAVVGNIDESSTVQYVSDDGYHQNYCPEEPDANPTAPQTFVSTADSEPTDPTTTSSSTTSPSTKSLPHRITETSALTSILPRTGFNVVLTHCTADFDSLASAVGLAKLWGSSSSSAITTNHDAPDNGATGKIDNESPNHKSFDSASHVPTYVVLPRGAHPGVQRFLGLHKHLFPIRSLKSILSSEHIGSLNRLALVDAQRRDRLGPAEPLLQHANRITIVDHHVDQDSDILANDYVMDQVGSVSTIIVERLQQAMIASPGHLQLTEAEATLLALGIHADTGNLCFDSTTVRDAYALAWCISQGASQTAIAEHGQSSLSTEQQGVLTQALVNANSTVVHGVTIATVLLQADGFINGLAAVTQDALELSSSDVFLLGLVYHAKSGSGSRKSKKGTLLTTQLLSKDSSIPSPSTNATFDEAAMILYAEAWQGGEEALRRRRLRVAFDRTDIDGSGYLDESEIATSLASSGVMALPDNATSNLIKEIDTDGDGKIDFEEFVAFATEAEKRQKERNTRLGRKGTTMIIIGRVKAGVNMKSVKLNKLLEQFGGGGHAKAASATVRLNDESEAEGILQSLVDELISTNLHEQPTVGDFVSFNLI